VIAWSLTGRFSPGYFVVATLAVTLNHIALNMTDDYYDYRQSVDRDAGQVENTYSGGSGVLTSGAIKPNLMRLVFLSLYFLTCVAGIYLTLMRGWPILAFGLVGVLSAYFYTAPPVRYAYRGFGEISQLLNFSLVIGLGAYYVQAQGLSWEAAFAVLPLGLMMFAMITINEIPDSESDGTGGKPNPRGPLRALSGGVALWSRGSGGLSRHHHLSASRHDYLLDVLEPAHVSVVRQGMRRVAKELSESPRGHGSRELAHHPRTQLDGRPLDCSICDPRGYRATSAGADDRSSGNPVRPVSPRGSHDFFPIP